MNLNPETVFRVVLAAVFFVTLIVRRVKERKADSVAEDGLQADLDDKRVIRLQSLLLAGSMIGILVYMINPTWMHWSSVFLPVWLRGVGVPLGVLGCFLLVWSHQALGDNFFGGMKVREGHQVITRGPYRWVRHPMYTAFIVLGVTFFLLSASWFIGALWLMSTALVLGTRIRQEEAMLAEALGAEYESYRAKTGLFIPRFGPR